MIKLLKKEQKESTKIRTGSWLLYCQETWKQKQKTKNQKTIIKIIEKVKTMRNVTSTLDHYPRNW